MSFVPILLATKSNYVSEDPKNMQKFCLKKICQKKCKIFFGGNYLFLQEITFFCLKSSETYEKNVFQIGAKQMMLRVLHLPKPSGSWGDSPSQPPTSLPPRTRIRSDRILLAKWLWDITDQRF